MPFYQKVFLLENSYKMEVVVKILNAVVHWKRWNQWNQWWSQTGISLDFIQNRAGTSD